MLKRFIPAFVGLFLVTPCIAEVGGIVTSPAGSNSSVQYNKKGLFSGDSQFTYSSSSYRLSVPGLTVSTITVKGITYYFPSVQSGGSFLRTDGSGNLDWSAPTTFTSSTGTAFAVWDGPVLISSPTGGERFEPDQFIATLPGGTTAWISLNTSSVTLLGPTPNLSFTTGNLPSERMVSTAAFTNKIQNFTAPQNFISSVTVRSDLGVTYGITAGTGTFSNLVSGECVRAGVGGQLTTIGADCGDVLAVTAGYGLTGGGTSGSLMVSLKPNATGYIQNRETLQADTTAYPYRLYVGGDGSVSGNLSISTATVLGQIILGDGTIIRSTSTLGGNGSGGGVVVPSTFTWGTVTLSTVTASNVAFSRSNIQDYASVFSVSSPMNVIPSSHIRGMTTTVSGSTQTADIIANYTNVSGTTTVSATGVYGYSTAYGPIGYGGYFGAENATTKYGLYVSTGSTRLASLDSKNCLGTDANGVVIEGTCGVSVYPATSTITAPEIILSSSGNTGNSPGNAYLLTINNTNFAGPYESGLNFAMDGTTRGRIYQRNFNDALPQTFSTPMVFEVTGKKNLWIHGSGYGGGVDAVSVGGPSVVSTMTVIGNSSIGSTPAIPPTDGLYVQGLIKNDTLSANLGVCTDGNKQLTTSGCSFGVGGGSSALAVTVGPVRSSPTSDVMFNPNQMSGVVSGSSITISLQSSSVTLQGNSITFTDLQARDVAIGASTASLRTDMLAVGVATASLRTQLNTVGVDTQTLRTDLIAVGVTTASLRTSINTVGVSTQTLATSVGLATASLRTDVDLKAVRSEVSASTLSLTTAVNGKMASFTWPTCTGTDKLTSAGTTPTCAADQTGGGGSGSGTVNAASQFSLPYYSLAGSSNVLGAFPGVTASTNTGVSISTLTVSSMTFSGTGNLSFANPGSGNYQVVGSSANVTVGHLAIFTSSWSIADGGSIPTSGSGGGISLQPSTTTINISSGLVLSGSAGTSGQFMKSNGPGTVPSWQTASGTGDAVLADTQTWTGGNTLYGNTTFYGEVAWVGKSTVTFENVNLQITQNSAVPMTGITNSPIQVVGNVDSFLQQNIQNFSTGTAASADYIATSNLGGNTSNYVNLGINSNNYSQTAFSIMQSTAGYLYSSDHSLVIGAGSNGTDPNADVVFFTSAPITGNERMRIKTASADSNGIVISTGVIGSSITVSGKFIAKNGSYANTFPYFVTSTTDTTTIQSSTHPALGASVIAGSTYYFDCYLMFSSTATQNGIQLGMGVVSGANSFLFGTAQVPFAAAGAGGEWQGYLNGNGLKVTSTGVAAANTVYTARLFGYYFAAGNATLSVMYSPETPATLAQVTIRGGSVCSFLRNPS